MVADATKSVAASITDKALAKEVMDLSNGMAKHASAALVADWEPGDELCPPWPWPWPDPRPPWWLNAFGPRPEPWKAVLAAEQIELAHVLTMLSGLTSSKEFNTALKVPRRDWPASPPRRCWVNSNAAGPFPALHSHHGANRRLK